MLDEAPSDEERINARLAIIKSGIKPLLMDETMDRILNEEREGIPGDMKWRGRPIHYSQKDGRWKFTTKPVKYAFS